MAEQGKHSAMRRRVSLRAYIQLCSAIHVGVVDSTTPACMTRAEYDVSSAMHLGKHDDVILYAISNCTSMLSRMQTRMHTQTA